MLASYATLFKRVAGQTNTAAEVRARDGFIVSLIQRVPVRYSLLMVRPLHVCVYQQAQELVSKSGVPADISKAFLAVLEARRSELSGVCATMPRCAIVIVRMR